jgi:hypothetical protein
MKANFASPSFGLILFVSAVLLGSCSKDESVVPSLASELEYPADHVSEMPVNLPDQDVNSNSIPLDEMGGHWVYTGGPEEPGSVDCDFPLRQTFNY